MARRRGHKRSEQRAASSPQTGVSFRSGALTFIALVYVAFVLWADIYLQHFFARPMLYGADVFKFVAWFVVPFVFCLPRLDLGWFGVKRWTRNDYYLFAAVIVVEFIAVVSVVLLPKLRAALPNLHDESVLQFLIWNLSWLVGWEFMHRYVLLRRLSASWPRWGWMLIPFYEAAYHLPWPSLAMPAGMFVFSCIATYWALKRRNGLLPFLAHLIIECQLTLFLLFT